jgi:hypothetical protein
MSCLELLTLNYVLGKPFRYTAGLQPSISRDMDCANCNETPDHLRDP